MAGPGKHGPSEVFIYLDGYDLTPEQYTDAFIEEEAETAEVSGLGTAFRQHAPTGMARCAIELNGAVWRSDADRIHDRYSTGLMTSDGATPQATPKLVTVGFAGSTIGAECEGFEGVHQVSYRVTAVLDDLQRANAAYLVSGARDEMRVIHPLSTETAAGNTQAQSSRTPSLSNTHPAKSRLSQSTHRSRLTRSCSKSKANLHRQPCPGDSATRCPTGFSATPAACLSRHWKRST
jgi:hypothetical protein